MSVLAHPLLFLGDDLLLGPELLLLPLPAGPPPLHHPPLSAPPVLPAPLPPQTPRPLGHHLRPPDVVLLDLEHLLPPLLQPILQLTPEAAGLCSLDLHQTSVPGNQKNYSVSIWNLNECRIFLLWNFLLTLLSLTLKHSRWSLKFNLKGLPHSS